MPIALQLLSGLFNRPYGFAEGDPYVTTDSPVVLSNAVLFAPAVTMVVVTVKNTGAHAAVIEIEGSNLSDFSDILEQNTATQVDPGTSTTFLFTNSAAQYFRLTASSFASGLSATVVPIFYVM